MSDLLYPSLTDEDKIPDDLGRIYGTIMPAVRHNNRGSGAPDYNLITKHLPM